MVTREDVESFLIRMEENVEDVGPGMWVLGGDGGALVIHYSPPLLLLRAKVMAIPEESRCGDLFRTLLELNARDLVHGAYGIEGADVILTDTLELEHLEFNTFQAAVDSIQIALASHLERLAPFREC
jgi:hypothetical protein